MISMRAMGVLGLLIILAFAVIAFDVVIDLNTDISALTTGPLQALAGALPTFWMLLVGMLCVVGILVAAAAMFH